MIALVSTSYCLHGTMADGSYTRPGSAANNMWPLGTKLYVTPPVYGSHEWVIRDRIGYGTQLDFWTDSCATAVSYGRRTVQVRVGWTVQRRPNIKTPARLAVRAGIRIYRMKHTT